MKWEAHTIPKYKAGNRPGDDVCLVIPGICAAVFDGATRSDVSPVSGISAGRAAALAAAQSLGQLAGQDLSGYSADDILTGLNGAVGEQATKLEFEAPIQTTAAIVLETDGHFRILVIGDTAIRLNRAEVITQDLKVDRLSIAARCAIWRHLRKTLKNDAKTEAVTRNIFVRGLPWAVQQGLIGADDVQMLGSQIKRQLEPEFHAYVDVFLMQGIGAQRDLMNNPAHPLWYPILDGCSFQGGAMERIVPMEDVQSIEIFSDGYSNLPQVASVDAWEAAYLEEEQRDPHRLAEFPGVKGSTKDEWNDDRSVVIGKA